MARTARAQRWVPDVSGVLSSSRTLRSRQPTDPNQGCEIRTVEQIEELRPELSDAYRSLNFQSFATEKSTL